MRGELVFDLKTNQLTKRPRKDDDEEMKAIRNPKKRKREFNSEIAEAGECKPIYIIQA